MNRLRTSLLAAAATLAVAAPVGLVAGPAAADGPERTFTCGGAKVDFSIEKDDRRIEVDVDIDDAEPGSRWKVVLRHNGTKFHARTHRADDDGDVDFDRKRPDTRGKDAFVLRVKPAGATACTARLSVR